jgi:hypothetical protein
VLAGVIAIAAGLAVAGGFGSPDTALVRAAPRQALIVCSPDGAIARTDRVVAVRDGVHLSVENAGGADRLAIRSASDELLGDVPVPLEGQAEATLALPPGPVSVSCSAEGRDDPGADVLTVVDPGRRWVSPELGCDADTLEHAELVTGLIPAERARSTARRAVTGLLTTDELRTPGYPASKWHGDLLVVFRGGRPVARIARAQDGGAWHVFVESCPGEGLVPS